MNSFFEDNFMNEKMLKLLTRAVKAEQINNTIKEIDYYREVQKYNELHDDLPPLSKDELQFIKKFNNAKKRKKIQA